MNMKQSRKSAFTLVEVMIVVSTIGLLAAIAVPNYVKARQLSQEKSCIANLRQIDSAVTTWALERHQATGAAIDTSELFGVDNYIRVKPVCPAKANGDYTYARVGDIPQAECDQPGHVLE
jgi:prepilin-type N-terminal cleavage/methylation domain-containing protein